MQMHSHGEGSYYFDILQAEKHMKQYSFDMVLNKVTSRLDHSGKNTSRIRDGSVEKEYGILSDI